MAVDPQAIRQGIHSPIDDWLAFNRVDAFTARKNLAFVAPLPPRTLMQNTTGLTDGQAFAGHGCDILAALWQACPTPLNEFANLLDFGVGVGRLARMFKGFRGRYIGVDVDARHVQWVSSALDHVTAIATRPRHALPLVDGQFDLIISVSVFTHMNEADQFFYLSELKRVAKPGATLLLTVHGAHALRLGETQPHVFEMLTIPRQGLVDARAAFGGAGFQFILQHGHLTSRNYDYGITFISENYVRREWAKFFDVVGVRPGAIHGFQDIVVLKAK
ncbi:MAG: class I SAM-dependent methyltransferase [Rhodospirillaceae bacterium]|nr:class I SAM-dependent methyltransferase [Rhodospirillaceae bacterium]